MDVERFENMFDKLAQSQDYRAVMTNPDVDVVTIARLRTSDDGQAGTLMHSAICRSQEAATIAGPHAEAYETCEMLVDALMGVCLSVTDDLNGAYILAQSGLFHNLMRRIKETVRENEAESAVQTFLDQMTKGGK